MVKTYPFPDLLTLAARLVAEEGATYSQAKQQAAQQLRFPRRVSLPDNEMLEDAIIQHIQLFLSDTQPQELKRLRQIALKWMRLLDQFSPYLYGAVWHGTATRHSDIYIQLFCDDPKAAEIYLINQNISYSAAETQGMHQKMIYTLCLAELVPEWGHQILVYIAIYNDMDIRGALKKDSKGRVPRGDIQAVQELLA